MSRRAHAGLVMTLLTAFAGLGLLSAGGPLPGDRAGIELAQSIAIRPVARFFEGPVDAVILPLAALLGVATAFYRRRLKLAVVFAVTWPSITLSTLAKLAVERPRPAGDFAILSSPDSWSFPSGHAYLAAVVAGAWVLFATEPPGLSRRRAVFAVAAIVIVIAGFSRAWLGAHWPSDVLGAWLLAALVLAVATPLGSLTAIIIGRAHVRLGFTRRLPAPTDRT